jgi:hypothetical protein
VLDASAAIDWLLQTPAGQRIEQRIYARQNTLHSVHLLDVEFLQVLRCLVRQGILLLACAPRNVRVAGHSPRTHSSNLPPLVWLRIRPAAEAGLILVAGAAELYETGSSR